MRLADLAAALGREVEGDGEVGVRAVAALTDAGPGDLSFVRSAHFSDALAVSKAAAVIAAPDIETGGRATLRSPQPGLDFARAARLLHPAAPVAPGVHPSAVVEAGARVDPTASVGPQCVVGEGACVGARSVLHAQVTLYAGVEVGRDCALHAGSVLREGTRLGDRVVVHAGAVLGGEGFGYVADEQGGWEAAPQLGGVSVEADVEIGAQCTIDRAAFGETRLRRGAKLDNAVVIGHGCDIGEDVLIGAQAGLAGSVRIGRGAIVMPQAGIVDHVSIGEGAYVGPRSAVTSNVGPGERVLGAPHNEISRQKRIWSVMRQLPEVLLRLRALERDTDGGSQ